MSDLGTILTDFVQSYFPSIADLTPQQVLAQRDELETWIRTGFPDEDTRPNSILGDRVLSPYSHFFAAENEALRRLASDIDLGNVQAGITYSCPFVQRYLQNFGVFDTTTLQSRGIVRLAFNANAQVTLDASLQLQLSGVTFTLELPFAGPLVILPVGSVFASGTNCVILSDLSNGSFAADIFVTGGSGSAVAAGTSSTFSATIPGLVSAVAIADFDKGNPVSGIANAAARTQQSFVSATPASRQGITKMLNNEYPDLVGSSVSLPGDPTNTRSTVSALGFGNPAVDIFIHSTQYGLLQTQRVLLPLVASQGGHTINKFIGQLSLIERPMQITQVVSAQDATIAWVPGLTSGINIISKSLGGSKAPLGTCSGTRFEALWLILDMPYIGSSTALSTTLVAGVPSAYFDVTYRTEPLLPSVSAVLESAAYKAVGLDILARPCIPAEITRFVVNYRKNPGVTVNLTAAAADITSLLKSSCGANPFSFAKLVDIMFFHKAIDVTGVEVEAQVHFTPADSILPPTISTPDSDYLAAFAAAMPPPNYKISSVAALTPTDFVDPKLGTSGETLTSLNAAALSFVLAAGTVTFRQV